MRTAGEILSGKRNQLGLSLDQIEKDTKIRKKYLEAIEKNNYSFFSESTTVKGFIRNYALILEIPPENILAIFRRDFIENEKGQIIPRGFTKEIEEYAREIFKEIAEQYELEIDEMEVAIDHVHIFLVSSVRLEVCM